MTPKNKIGGKKLQAQVMAVKALLHGELLSAVSTRTGFDTKSLREWRKQFELGGTAQLAGITARDLERTVPHHFISYSRKDRKIAFPVFDELRASGIKIWIDERAIRGGAAWRAEIDKAIRKADVFILFLSQYSVDSNEVIRELKLAIKLDKDVLPVKLRPLKITPTIQKLIGGTQFISLTSYRRERTVLLLEALGETDIPSAPPYQQMVFRNNVNRICESIRFLQNCSLASGQIILEAINDSDDGSYVQFAVQSELDIPLHAQAVGDKNRAKKHKLSIEQKITLARLGWRKPSQYTWGNYWNDFPAELESERRALAKTLLRTLIEVYGHLSGEDVNPELQQNK